MTELAETGVASVTLSSLFITVGGVVLIPLCPSSDSIWFWSRPDVPAGVSKTATTIDTSTLGLPVAFWPSTGCSPISDFISKQRTVLDM